MGPARVRVAGLYRPPPPAFDPPLPLPLLPLALPPFALPPLEPPERPPLPVGSDGGAEVVVLGVVVVVVVGLLAEEVDVGLWFVPLGPLDGVELVVPPWVGAPELLFAGFANWPPPLVWVGPYPLDPEGWDGDMVGVLAELGELGVVGVDVVGVLGAEGVGWVPLPNADDPRYGAFPDAPEAGGVTPTVGVEGLNGFVDGAEPERPDVENGCSTPTGAALALLRPVPAAALVQSPEEPVPTMSGALAEPTARLGTAEPAAA
ncbi:MAG TPA: hypothetical protein VMD48_14830 [Solirubrobacteraceae bacterium]|nr:hypothetical protein [Solirubrobacteraceae bacterium]